MIISTGIDIIEVDRVRKNIEKYGEKFLNKVYTESEIEYCEGKKIQRYESYAGRFAAKEAVFKAISWMLDGKFDVDWKDIEVINDKRGRPLVSVNNNSKISNLEEIISIDISISHVKNMAVASVVIVTNNF